MEEIFVNYETVKDIVGAEEIEEHSAGRHRYLQLLRQNQSRSPAADGRRQVLQPASITRKDLMSLTEECTKVTGIPYVMDAYREEAEAILNG